MYILKFAHHNPKTAALEEHLRALSLGFKTEEVTTLEAPELHNGKLLATGFEAITTHLEELAGELNDWYYCSCN
ncbi:MAG: hypothetical protein AAGG75_15765 [Bacteroidota bacterium]